MDRNRNELNTQQAPGVAKNPFEMPAARPFDPRALFGTKSEQPAEVPADAPEGSYTYALVKSGPEVPAEECEQQAEAIEIMILWGSSVLHVEHLSPARSFFVGEEGTDFVLPADKLGTSRMPVVLVGKDGVARAVIPATATAKVELEGQPVALETLSAEPCAELVGASQIALRLGARAKIEIGGVTIQVASVKAGRTVKAAPPVSGKGLPWHGVSFAIHAGLLAAAAFFLPPMGANAEDGISADDKYFIQHALDSAAEREQDKREDQPADANAANGGDSGQRSSGSEGKAGSTTSRNTSGRMGFAGPKDNTDVQVAKQAAIDDARSFGMIGLLSTMSGGDPNALTARWGGDVTVGNDERSALGNIWGETLDDAAGSGGLGLSGNEEGGGGKGIGIGIDRIGTVGGGLGGPGGGYSRGLPQRAHKASAPIVRAQGISASGKLPSEVIQRIVRQNFGRYRFCYEQGLRTNPNLAGRVAVKFVIGRDGAVSQVSNGGSDMPDGNVTSCVVRSFYGLSFPAPENGIVTVTYPIMFQPGS